MRARLAAGAVPPATFRAELRAVPARDRDAWLDAVLDLDEVPDDGPALERGCVPYLPCAVDTLVRTIELAGVTAADVVVDLGAGVGRATTTLHLATGAAAIGLEVQPALVARAHALVAGVGARRVFTVAGRAEELVARAGCGTVFFLYCPFGGARLSQALAHLEAIARGHPIRVCAVDLPLPPTPWLDQVAADGDLVVHRSRG
ncbi:MAG: hypothetical protein R2939_06720 [Kofleriaceae bacterium]